MTVSDWRRELPTLAARVVTLREPIPQDFGPLVDLLSISDATRFGIDEPIGEVAVQAFIERARRNRAIGSGFTYVASRSSVSPTRTSIGRRSLSP